MSANHDFDYANASDLLSKVSLQQILELATEGLFAIEGEEEDVSDAIGYLDGTNDIDDPADLSDEARHIAFVIEESLASAEGTVNSFAGRLLDLPVLRSDGAVPGEVKDAVLKIARYNLFSRRSVIPDGVLMSHSDAMKWLDRLAAGKVVVNLLTDTEAAVTPEARSRVGTADRTASSFSSFTF